MQIHVSLLPFLELIRDYQGMKRARGWLALRGMWGKKKKRSDAQHVTAIIDDDAVPQE